MNISNILLMLFYLILSSLVYLYFNAKKKSSTFMQSVYIMIIFMYIIFSLPFINNGISITSKTFSFIIFIILGGIFIANSLIQKNKTTLLLFTGYIVGIVIIIISSLLVFHPDYLKYIMCVIYIVGIASPLIIVLVRIINNLYLKK